MQMHTCPRVGCGAVFPRPYRLAAHVLLHDNKKEFKCTHENCNREYTSNSHLLRHYASAHKPPENDSIFSCPLCSKEYSNRQNLKRHIKTAHMYGVPYKCDECQKGFTKKHKLTAHMHKHNGVEGFCCEFCPKSFVTLHEKKRHLRFHKSYQCDECDAIFQHWSKLQDHRKKGHLKKEFICHHCNRNFKKRTHMVRHVKLHNEDKRVCFQCPVLKCFKFYTTKFNLNQHMEAVHCNKTFDCLICDAKLSTKAKLARHAETHKPKAKTTKPKMTVRKTRKDKGKPKNLVVAKLAGIKISTQCRNYMPVEEKAPLTLTVKSENLLECKNEWN